MSLDLPDPDALADVEELRRTLVVTQRQLAKQKARTDELVAATIEA